MKSSKFFDCIKKFSIRKIALEMPATVTTPWRLKEEPKNWWKVLFLIQMQHCRIKATDGVEFWISCKQPAFLSSFGLLQVIQNKRPWCWNAAYVTAG